MKHTLSAETSVTINAAPAKVWKAITTPASIQKYLMGTTVTSDWKEGSPITYEGEYNGKKYHDKGIIKKLRPETIFESTYWSSMSGKEDKPENYNTVTYTLSDEDDRTLVVLKQDNIATKEEQAHAAKNWEQVLQKLKEVVEQQE